METKDLLRKLREDRGLTQEAMAERLHLSRQAVSRWETGETLPSVDTLKLISQEFSVSINTLLGSPKALICQCCGMPLSEDSLISTEPDGALNEDYCKWCYHDGQFTYHSMQTLIDTCVPMMLQHNPDWSEEDVRAMMEQQLPTLQYWKEKAEA